MSTQEKSPLAGQGEEGESAEKKAPNYSSTEPAGYATEPEYLAWIEEVAS